MTTFAWLIELKPGEMNPPVYWGKTGGYSQALGWIHNHENAIRFARERDAQAWINAMRWPNCRAVEHGWDEEKIPADYT